MTINDVECAIHLKGCLLDGTLDVRTLWLSDSTIRIVNGPCLLDYLILKLRLPVVLYVSFVDS